MEQRPRKNRGSSQRSSNPSSNKSPMRGSYTNEALVAEVPGLLGFVVEATTREGTVYEGVLTAISPDLDIILELAHIKTEKLSRENVQKSLALKFCDIVTVTAKVTSNPSMEQKEGLKLDRDISSCAGSSTSRELQPFTDFEESENNAKINLGLDGSGWGPEEMWRENEEKFNVQSTYDESLIQYTTPLERADTEEFRKKEARAERLASEIENKQDWPALNDNIESTEEERFSAVMGSQTYANMGPQSSCPETNSKLSDTSVSKDILVVALGTAGAQTKLVQPTDVMIPSSESEGDHVPQANGDTNFGDAKEGDKNKDDVIKAFQLNPSAKEFTPSVSAKEFTPLGELVLSPSSALQSTIMSPLQSPQTFYSPNKGRFSSFPKPRPRPFFSPDSPMVSTPTGYMYQSPSVSVSPQPLVRPFVPGPVVMPGPYAMPGVLSPHQQLFTGKMMEFVPQVMPTMGQMAGQSQHYIGSLGQPGQPFPVPPQMIQANQQLFYVPQGTVPNFVPAAQPGGVMPQFLMFRK